MAEQIDTDLQRKVARAELSRRAFWLSLGLFIATFFGGLGWTVYEVRQTQTEGTPTGRRIVALQTTIEDCVNPAGECYKRSRANQESIVQTLNLGAVYAVFCVQRNPDAELPGIKDCVRALYERDQAKTP